MVLDAIGFDALAEGADLVITGEGRMDSQTLKGKAPLCVLRHALRLGIPTVALTGLVSDYDLIRGLGYKEILSINPPGQPLEIAMQPATARCNLYNTVKDYFDIV